MLPARARSRGFSLLEVMVAVAILGLSLTVILSAQVGLFSSGTYAQHLSESLGLARCRMTELDEQFLKLGYPLVDTTDEGPCCNGDTRQDMRCAWKVERVILPNPPPMSMGDGGTPTAAGSNGLNLNTPSMFGAAPMPGGTSTTDPMAMATTGAAPPLDPMTGLPSTTMGLPGMTGMPGMDPSMMSGGLGPLGALMGATGSLPGMPGLGSSMSGSGTSGLSGILAAGAMGGTGAIAPMVFGIVYPSLKPTLEESIRKVTVTVYWREGMAKREVEIVQWVTNPVNGNAFLAAMGSGSGASSAAPMGGGPFPMGGGMPLGGGPMPMGGGMTPPGGIGR